MAPQIPPKNCGQTRPNMRVTQNIENNSHSKNGKPASLKSGKIKFF